VVWSDVWKALLDIQSNKEFRTMMAFRISEDAPLANCAKNVRRHKDWFQKFRMDAPL
jgi:hypothetical protein